MFYSNLRDYPTEVFMERFLQHFFFVQNMQQSYTKMEILMST